MKIDNNEVSTNFNDIVYKYLLIVCVPASGDANLRFKFRLDKTTLLRRFLSCKAVQNEHEIAKIRNVLPGVS